MSKLAVGNEDHAEAARKHRDDATVLSGAKRHDGVVYLSGYVAECSLKAVILHDQSYVPASGVHDPVKLNATHRQLSNNKIYGHKLANLAAFAVGVEGAKYLPKIPPTATILNWSPFMRYWPGGAVKHQTARAFRLWAEKIFKSSVEKMRLDGVI